MTWAARQRLELLQGTLDVLVLRTLPWGPQQGHGISIATRSTSRDAPQIDHGSLYPASHRLERHGWVDAEWKTTENEQRTKYYRLTAAGRRQLQAERDRWSRLIEAIARVPIPRKESQS